MINNKRIILLLGLLLCCMYCNSINSIPIHIVVDHQIFKMFNVAHLLEKVDDPSTSVVVCPTITFLLSYNNNRYSRAAVSNHALKNEFWSNFLNLYIIKHSEQCLIACFTVWSNLSRSYIHSIKTKRKYPNFVSVMEWLNRGEGMVMI